MKFYRLIHTRLPLLLAALCAMGRASFSADPLPILNAAAEQKLLIPKTADGGLPPLVGVQNIQVFRASKGAMDLSDGRGWTYNHHMDLAQWKGRMYLAWTNGEKDEDVWPAREMFISSDDGFHWSAPAELFPQGVSTSLRMYFFHATNGRMLTIAGLRTGTDKLAEANKGGIAVREIRADHTLAPPCVLQDGPAKPLTPTPKFETSADAGFVEACKQLLANHTFLEQQDFGRLLDTNRMAVYANADKDFGRAMCFFHRPDGTLVGIGKKAWEILSTDEGKTWIAPATIKSLITGNAKEWVQKTSDGKYAMIYNPSAGDRYPLVVMTSSDGITFDHMRTVHGEVPTQRYEGLNRSVGAQYTRGISEWARDDTAIKGNAAKDMWIVYSSSKEDIWVSRIPVPMRLDETAPVKDDFSKMELGALVPGWNTYAPKWGGVSLAEAPDKTHALKLEDRDPYDYAKAERVFAESAQVKVSLKVMTTGAGRLELELHSAFGEARPVRLVITQGNIMSGTVSVGTITPNIWTDLHVATLSGGKFTVAVDGKMSAEVPFAEKAEKVGRLTLRTGAFRAIGEGKFVDPATDKPVDEGTFLVKDVNVE